MTIITTVQGPQEFDLSTIYESQKAAFLADYADDEAIVAQVYRNGDLAKRAFLETMKHLNQERCARLQPEEIKMCIESQARLTLCNLGIAAGKLARRP